MSNTAKEIIRMSKAAFTAKMTLDTLWQEIALNFYPERADFTAKRDIGDEFADHLYSSYPVSARLELGNLISSNLRPQSQKWFSTDVDDEDFEKGNAEARFLERITQVQWRAMYHPKSQFVKATKQCDHDFSAFGNGVIHCGVNSQRTGLLYKNYHLRDCAWSENADGVVDVLYRRWKPSARQLVGYFGDKCASEVHNCMKNKKPEEKFNCLHVEMPASLYDRGRLSNRWDYVSLYIDVDNCTILEETPQRSFQYVVPRWQTVSGSQYGSSMATTVALPDGRTNQVITRTIREAAEKYVDPPLIAVGDAIRGDIPIYAGGITIADIDYDERLGDVLRPISQNQGGMPIGFEVNTAIRDDIRKAFFLDKVQLPEPGMRDMTAFEVRRRIEEHIRGAAPLFEPIEKDYNMPLCDITFDILLQNGAFGSAMQEMPETLEGQDLKFTFRSPLAEMSEQNEAEAFKSGIAEIFGPAEEMGMGGFDYVDFDEAIPDAAKSSGFKSKWLRKEEDIEKIRENRNAQREAEAQMAQAQQLGAAAEQGGKGLKQLMEAAE